MIGNNSLILNEATMIEALEYWLVNKVLNKDEPSPRITAVSADNFQQFKVSIEQTTQAP